MAEMRGIRQMSAKLRAIARTYPDRIAKALYIEANIEATEMKKITPVDVTPDAPHPGNLRNSIHVEEPVIKGNRISVTIATGTEAPYAIHVHENPDAMHKVGQWQFMASVLLESAPYMAARVANRIKF